MLQFNPLLTCAVISLKKIHKQLQYKLKFRFLVEKNIIYSWRVEKSDGLSFQDSDQSNPIPHMHGTKTHNFLGWFAH